MTTDIREQSIVAALARRHQPFELVSCTLSAPGAGEVRLRLLACGICHTDLSAREENLGTPLPAVLGHEGVGVIEAIGPGVDGFRIGERVVASFGACGHCPKCQQGSPGYCHSAALGFRGLRADGSSPVRYQGCPVTGHVFAQSSFASHAVVSVTNLVQLPDDLDPALMAPLACGVQTGMASVLIALATQSRHRVAVFGCGTVGLSAIMAARLLGCPDIVAVDIAEDRLALARELGATFTINSREENPVSLIRQRGGSERVLECTGIPEVILQAYHSLDSQGMLACAGVSKPGSQLVLDLGNLLFSGRSVRGTIEGDAVPREFIPRMIQWYREGLLPLDKLVTRYAFADINQAAEDMLAGRCIKPVLIMSHEEIP